ncbi:lysine--tRNA ligase [Nocardioides taihuensis]|uniref:Lysine--tRNA ligase n=1 Tax=Nocardioides taihuensis TaxID=1835606 RepID=A0ABW0BM68_9ACTN
MARRGGDNAAPPTDWVTRAADDAVRHAGEGKPVTVSSGISPSGPVHLGNLRELLTVHFVADELRRRGVPVRHLHVWDDYDRLRKVPREVDPSFAEHIGRPLSAVPDPWGCHPSWGEHFKEPLRESLHAMGVEMEEISQTERYTSGVYREQVLRAVRHRDDIEQVLARYRTRAVALEEAEEDEGDEEGPGAGAGSTALERFPYKPYCRTCGRDATTVTAYDDETTDLAYTCDRGHAHTVQLATQDEGKLVWKVDWPMRWAFEHVDFEPAGMDHATPGSSFTVGHELVEKIFGMPRPAWFGYGFVGFAGMQKMSGSAGGAPTAADALRVLEAPILRWLYVRRTPKQTFDIDFGPEVVRLYDEWDSLTRKAADPAKRDTQVLAWERASSTASGPLPTPPVVLPFRLLSSVADVTAGSAEQISRIVGHDVDELEPRLDRARAWMLEYVDAADRTNVRETPDTATLSALDDRQAEWLRLLRDGLVEPLDLDAVTALVYGVPKLARGMALDDKPTDEVKADQKELFGLLYRLLVDAERGPRLPTLVMALGAERVRTLLTPAG